MRLETKDGLRLSVRHKSEAAYEFVVLMRMSESTTTLTHLQPHEARDLAKMLTVVADYADLVGKGE